MRTMDLATFLRSFPLRSSGLMWLLGAGASAAAGIPTAGAMIWDFKRQLYCSGQRRDLRTCSDLTSPPVRAAIQGYLTSLQGSPADGSAEEYSYYFEAAYPSEADRRRYLETQLIKARPSYGHLALSVLLKMGLIDLLWTTNFDKVPEDAAAEMFGTTSRLRVATIDSAPVAAEALAERRFPLLGKLHGDFHSRRLKNTSEELRAQEAQLRQTLVEACAQFGLVVVGYSGRDDSVMDALTEALRRRPVFPGGLTWLHRADAPPRDRVVELLELAAANGVEAASIEIETFDELMADLVKLVPDIPEELADRLLARRPRLERTQLPSTKGSWPVLRLNALPVLSWPQSCRLVRCRIGGAKEIREAIDDSGARVVASRRTAGVIAFGDDREIRKAFGPHGIQGLDLFMLEQRRLRYDSAELSLLYEALCLALARGTGLRIERVGRRRLLVASRSAPSLAPLLQVAKRVEGRVRNLNWAEAIELRLEFRLDRLWLLLLPTVWVERTDDESLEAARKDFMRAQLADRYNPKSNALIDAWAKVLTSGEPTAKLTAFQLTEGINAAFEIGSTTAFSRRGGAV
jgi:NAD-dependent SIR2 family protein deacetylase